jgi:hypothetical protein
VEIFSSNLVACRVRIPSGDYVVVWATAIVAGIGIVLGLRLRVPALLAACFVVVVAWTAAAIFTGLPLLTVVGRIVGMLCVLQSGYLAGLLASCALSRVRSSPRSADLPPTTTRLTDFT